MEFHSYQREPMHSKNSHEYEDDVFYDELRRQVLQLTTEDEDDAGEGVCEKKITHRIEARKQSPLYGLSGVARPSCYFGWPGIKEDCPAAPAWMLSLWRSGNGTGVFLPQTVQSRSWKNKSRRKNEGVRTYRRIERKN